MRPPRAHRHASLLPAFAASAAAILFAAGCTGSTTGAGNTQTAQSGSGSLGAASSTTTGPPSTTAGASGSTSPAATETSGGSTTGTASAPASASAASASDLGLPHGCSVLVAPYPISKALGSKPIVAPPSYLRAAPEPASGRLGRVTCTYFPGAPPTATNAPKVDVTVNAYATPADVQGRINLTVSHDRARGNKLNRVTVLGVQGWTDVGPTSTTIFLPVGSRSLVVSIDNSLGDTQTLISADESIASIAMQSLPDNGLPTPLPTQVTTPPSQSSQGNQSSGSAAPPSASS